MVLRKGVIFMKEEKEQITKKGNNIRKIARIVSIIVGGYWAFALSMEVIMLKKMVWDLETTLLVTFVVILLISVVIAWINEKMGGTVLILAGIGFSIFAYFSAGHNKILAMLVSGVPFIICGILFLITWMEKRREKI